MALNSCWWALAGSGVRLFQGFALTRIGSGFHGSSPTLLSSDCDIMRIWATQGWRPHAGDGRVALQVLHCVLWDYLHETEIKSILFNLLYFGVSLSLSEPTHYAFKSYRPQHLNLLHQRVLEKSHIIIRNHSVLKSNDFFIKNIPCYQTQLLEIHALDLHTS